MAGHTEDWKYRAVYDYLKNGIHTRKFPAGSRLPTEHQLRQRFGVSRPTVVRAYLELTHEGLVERRRGSGSYVRATADARRLFGLLISGLFRGDGLDHSIFAPLAGALAGCAREHGAAILFHGAVQDPVPARQIEHARQMARDYCAQPVAGVFFLPLLLPPKLMSANRALAQELRQEGVAVVLLDRDLAPGPRRSPFDLSALDHRQAGYLLTLHLLEQGCRRVDFVAGATAAPSIQARIAGWREALREKEIVPAPEWLHRDKEFDPAATAALAAACRRADGIVCYNDEVAVSLGLALERQRVRVPQDLLLAGFDHAPVARQLPYQLTTMEQPVGLIGQGAVELMLQRLHSPDAPAQTRLYAPRLIPGASTAAAR